MGPEQRLDTGLRGTFSPVDPSQICNGGVHLQSLHHGSGQSRQMGRHLGTTGAGLRKGPKSDLALDPFAHSSGR